MPSCFTLSLLMIGTATACVAGESPLLDKNPEQLAYCGAMSAPPFGSLNDGRKIRSCTQATARAYNPTHHNIGVEALNIESSECFVPDAAYKLLDDIIDTVSERMKQYPRPVEDSEKRQRVLDIGRIAGEVMQEKGFALFVPVQTLGDALVPKSRPGQPERHVFDCDTGSLIVLSVAEALGVKASLVEITLSSGSGHNFVRWEIGNQIIDWDVNGRAQCVMPLNNPKFQGRSMTHEETTSYLTSLRGMGYDKRGEYISALNDYRTAINLFTEHPLAYNNFVWLVATKVFTERNSFKAEASTYAQRLLQIQPSANNLDTAACLSAFEGDFKKAALLEQEALANDPGNGTMKAREARFSSNAPEDCTGDN